MFVQPWRCENPDVQIRMPRKDKEYVLFQITETNALVGTILNVQPRLSGGGGGKSNDEIVYELADSILAKLTDALDLDQARQDMFEVSSRSSSHLQAMIH